jgi:hypothetical protein
MTITSLLQNTIECFKRIIGAWSIDIVEK